MPERVENPKMVGSNLIDCVPQKGPCPNACNQCYYNKWFYAGHEPFVPSEEEAAGKIVRVNSGHDSNIQKSIVLEATRHFSHRFYNTSIPNLDFENAPVVLTVNPREDHDWVALENTDNLMYVRARVDTWNIDMVQKIISHYTSLSVPVVLTFTRYYDMIKKDNFNFWYRLKKHVLHDYWDVTEDAWWMLMATLARNTLVFSCGSPYSSYCRDCGVCETLYWRLLTIEGRADEIIGGIKPCKNQMNRKCM
jgi:hypothetical protein